MSREARGRVVRGVTQIQGMSTRIPLVCRKCGVIGHHDVSTRAEANAPLFWVARCACGALSVAALGCEPSDDVLDAIDAALLTQERERERLGTGA